MGKKKEKKKMLLGSKLRIEWRIMTSSGVYDYTHVHCSSCLRCVINLQQVAAVLGLSMLAGVEIRSISNYLLISASGLTELDPRALPVGLTGLARHLCECDCVHLML